MEKRNFRDLLEARWASGTMVCVGLDTEEAKLPTSPDLGGRHAVADFNCRIFIATHDLVCAIKPNLGFYLGSGEEGVRELKSSFFYMNQVDPRVPIIFDAKVGDIGKTNIAYARAAFEYLNADAITVNPYVGSEALQPFLEMKDKGIIVLCRTSNPGAGEFQDLIVDGVPLYIHVARRVAEKWNKNGNCLLVVGATCPEELRAVRKEIGDMPILVPGVGTQGGDVEKVVMAGMDSRGLGLIVNSSSAIIYASKGVDYAEAARRETLSLRDQISKCRFLGF